MCILSLIDCFKEKCALSPILAFLLSRYISKKKSGVIEASDAMVDFG